MINKVTSALISVSDKTGVVEFARALQGLGVQIISTGGTAKLLEIEGVKVTEISSYTGFPEMMDGRVKTLHPKVHGGLLALRDNSDHKAAMKEHNIPPIDMVVVNLYPFEATVARGADFETCIENIDIGGPSMIRSGAKNWQFVSVLVDPADYACVLEEIKNTGGVSDATNKVLSAKAFTRTAAYDAAISSWFNQKSSDIFPEKLVVSASLKQTMRYGENPHQQAAYYVTREASGISSGKQLQGKELSYNNINDADAALKLVSEFAEPAAVIIKHANPCGAAVGADIGQAYLRAFSCDTVSAFGGIVAMNREVNGSTATEIAKTFYEVIIAPKFTEDALKIFEAKKNLRVLEVAELKSNDRLEVKSVAGGFLVQQPDNDFVKDGDIKVVSQKQPTVEELKNLQFAMKVCKHVRSNAIVIASDYKAIGVGAGQMSRVKSVEIACEKAVEGAVMASDAFFPFADNVELAAKAGISAIIQPGGSVRDEEVIDACNKHGIALVFTGMRHFKH